MRTIKFKGKCISPEFKGKTVCGSLLTFPDGTARLFEHSHDKVFNYYSVDPDTVCQFTGITDKNGKEIYEGDVLRSDLHPFSQTAESPELLDVFFALVAWHGAFGMYQLRCYSNKLHEHKFGEDLDDLPIKEFSALYCKNLEVVGSIHDKEWQEKLNLNND